MSAPADRSRQVAALFDRVAGTYDAVGVPWFTPIANRLVTELAPAPGERVLDVGCGRGALLFPAAQAVGPTGHVVGIDLAPAMVSATLDDVLARGSANVEMHVMDASAPELPQDSFDVVASSLVLFFLPDPAAALAAWYRLLAPSGRMGVTTFGPRDPLWVELDEVFTPFLPPQMLDARTSGTSGPFASDEGVEGLLRDAGLVDVRTLTSDLVVRFADVATWERWTWSHGQRAMWEHVPDDERPGVLATAGALLERSRDADGVLCLTQSVRCTLGRKA